MSTASGAVGEGHPLPPGPPRDAVDVATLLSTTVRVEPELLRAVRVALLPQADVGAESDLWFSRWVATRNPRAMVLLPDVQRALRPRLPEVLGRCASPPGLTAAEHLRELITGRHGHLSPLMRLEEEVQWLVASGAGGGAGVREAEAALGSALRALVEHEGREAIADWIVSVCPRLPEPLRDTVTGWQFRAITRFLEPGLNPDRAAPAGLTCPDVGLVLDAVAVSGEAEVPDTLVAVRLAGEVLTVADASAGRGAVDGAEGDGTGPVFIRVPATDPVVLELLPGADGRGGRPIRLRAGESVTVTGCPPTPRLVTADRRVYAPSDAARAGGGGRPASTTPGRTVILGPRPVTDTFCQQVYDSVCARLRQAGHAVWDLGTLWSSVARPGHVPWPGTVDAVVFLLDRELIVEPAVRDQIETLVSWSADTGAPRPLLVPLRGVRRDDRQAQALPGGDACHWMTYVNDRVWRKDCPWSAGHALYIAGAVASQVGESITGAGHTPPGRHTFPTRFRILARMADRRLSRYVSHGDRGALDRAVDLFPPDLTVFPADDPGAASAFLRQARARRHRARLTGSARDAERAVDLLRQVLDGTSGESGPRARVRATALRELLLALRVRTEIAGAAPLPDGVVAALDEAVALARAAHHEDRSADDRSALAVCLAPAMASDAWLRRHPRETEAAARLNLEAAGVVVSGSSTEPVIAARTAARLALDAGAVSLAVRAFARWFTLLEGTEWTRLDGARFAALTEGFIGAPENAAACAVAADEPPTTVLRLLERGLAVHRVVLAGRSVLNDEGGRSCRSREERLDRLGGEAARLTARWTPDERRAVTARATVVVLVAADAGGGALILDGDTATAVPLPGLTSAAVAGRAPEDPAVREALVPALRELERGPSAGDSTVPRRVYWCPTGPLARLPVHEAWSGEPGTPAPVSSYATSVSDLFMPRHDASAGGPYRPAPSRVLLVVSPTQGDDRWAERAEAEVRTVRDTGIEVDLLVGAQATRRAVLEAAADVEFVHLVCRPTAAPGRGGGWAIVLADGPLTAADIAATDLSATRLVLLSGYGEAVGAGTDPDRDTLAGSLHRAGCRHVVASLSAPGTGAAVHDLDAPVARFYDALLDGDGRPWTDRVALALHEATAPVHGTERRRNPYPSFVHIGS